MTPLTLLRFGLAAAAVVLGVVAYRIQVDAHSLHDWAKAIVATAWSFVLAGLVAWWRRPEHRVGPLMTAAGFALLLRQLRYSHDPALFTTFFALGDLGYALVGHSVLAYPTGKVTDRLERLLVKVGYATVLAFPVATLLFYDGSRQLIGYADPAPHESLLLIRGNADVVEALQKGLVIALFGVLSTLFIVVIVRRLFRATPRGRRVLAPLWVAAVAIALRAVFETVFTFVDRPFAADYLFWWQISASMVLPAVFLAGLARARLARTALGELVLELERTPPEGVRDALARALGDPGLDVAFWLPERGEFVDGAGQPVELPGPADSRAVTQLEHEGEPVAALIHDRSLLEEPRLVRSAGAAARMAIANARLQVELRAQLDEVRASRKRIVAAGDSERRRIERNLHDGAQQHLVAIALKLRTAQRQLGDPAIGVLLAETVAELQTAVEDLRELARGVHPAILTEEGLAAALASLAHRSPLPLTLVAEPEDRFNPEVEATAYFLVCEALANVAKHSQASEATVSATRTDGLLVVEVADDGVGGARPADGSGLTGLADRVEALGGRLRIESPSGGGTTIVAEIPCGS
jgi:signal transduction histidine kinase